MQTLDPSVEHFWLSPLARPLLDRMGKPRYPERFERLVAPLLDLDHRGVLPHPGCPTLVLGGQEDRVIDASVQREMAQLIPNSRLKLAAGYGHGNSFANPNYAQKVQRFLEEVMAPTK